jgi:hypothetical protein
VRRFLAAWPERDLPEESIRSWLTLTIEEDSDGPMLVASLLGHTISFGVPTDQSIEQVADELADHLADNAEGDRWTGGGDAWREWKP